VRKALARGWVGGLHYHFCGGRGPDIAFRIWDEYLPYVRASRAGDWFLLWSVAEVQSRRRLLAGQMLGETQSESSFDADLRAIETYLAKFQNNIQNEFFALGLPKGETRVRAIYSDIDRFAELTEMLQECRSLGGEWYVLPASDLDHEEFHLLNTKRPNEKGDVPIGGAY
jgi:hypothetical protein